MFGGVKITLIISLTILTSCVLLISYNECTNRYIMHGNSDNTIYIFDKKSTTLNLCTGEGCKVIETKFPKDSPLALAQSFSPSKMFGGDKAMTDDVKAKVEAEPKAPEESEAKKEEAKKEEKEEKKPEEKDAKKEEEKKKAEGGKEEFVE
ncbi:MAG: hypothetical protein LBJ69_01900 [Holosporales bacterium]|jgi:hypothetical protein|nr:hypothetical protein [Holosporales bacterium]